ncbi:GNAT family N-acetyltransferase [Lysinibacillus agricola]|uniref:GNAT family N-acetyltransferase n=1 Tax=Lysinibacillus agricola TaxID=2590012 RepID=A0ABX7AN73_9BACI|nr:MULTISPECIES: GNAT family N-acetyltransferase [Lysinibacillus]QQP10961.1 GNAT family N-acetyltransferase [Lysinibacillus agricola]
MSSIIRHMQKNDIIFVQEIAKKSWHQTYEGIIPNDIQDRFLQTAYSSERLLGRLENSLFLVAILEDSIVGFANFSNVVDGEAELYAIYLLPETQGKGIGTALLREGINLLPDVTSLLVCVEKENAIGMNFYQAKGFKKLEEFDELFDGHLLKTVKLGLTIT